MKWEDIKAKLTSRKFWVTVITFLGLILVTLNVDNLTTERIVGVICSFSILLVYMIAETFTDIANRKLTAGEVVVVNIAQKLTSRKFWAALVSFITTLLISLGVDMLTIEQVETMIMAVATVAIYILGEGAVDVSKIRAELNQSKREVKEETEEMVDGILDNVLPASKFNEWYPMYIFSKNHVCTNVFTEPNYNEIAMSLAHLTRIYVDTTVAYGEAGQFYKFTTDELMKENEYPVQTEFFIEIDQCVDGYANSEIPVVTEDVPAEETPVEQTEDTMV